MEIRVIDSLRQKEQTFSNLSFDTVTIGNLIDQIRNPPSSSQLWDDHTDAILVHLGAELSPSLSLSQALLSPAFPAPLSPTSPTSPTCFRLFLFTFPRQPSLVVNTSAVVKADELRPTPQAQPAMGSAEELLALFMRLSGTHAQGEAAPPFDPSQLLFRHAGAAQAPPPTRTMNSQQFLEHLTERNGDALAMLVSLGFSQVRSLNALLVNQMQPEAAIEWLLQNQQDLNDLPLPAEQLVPVASSMGIALEEPVPEVVTAAISAQVCTFTTTGREFCFQRWYQCVTCGLQGSAGVCVVCAIRCHAGHQLSPRVRATGFYCDCGSGAYCRALVPPGTGGEGHHSCNSHSSIAHAASVPSTSSSSLPSTSSSSSSSSSLSSSSSSSSTLSSTPLTTTSSISSPLTSM